MYLVPKDGLYVRNKQQVLTALIRFVVADSNTDVDFNILSHWLSGITHLTTSFKHTRIFVIPRPHMRPQRTNK